MDYFQESYNRSPGPFWRGAARTYLILKWYCNNLFSQKRNCFNSDSERGLKCKQSHTYLPLSFYRNTSIEVTWISTLADLDAVYVYFILLYVLFLWNITGVRCPQNNKLLNLIWIFYDIYVTCIVWNARIL